MLLAWQCCKISCHSKRRLCRSSVSFGAFLRYCFVATAGWWFVCYVKTIFQLQLLGVVYSDIW
jgi:hypothetical protein